MINCISIIIASILSSLILLNIAYIVTIVKRRCTNTIIDNRQLADDGLLYSSLNIYLNKLILCKPNVIDDDGNPITVKYQCG